MALEYALYMETDLGPEQALLVLFEGDARIDKSGESTKTDVFMTSGPGFQTYAFETSFERRSFLKDELGVDPSLTILFRVDKFQNREDQIRVILDATIRMLQQTHGNVILLANGEIVWLLRKSGKLILNRRTNLWTPNLMALVTLGYEIELVPDL
jgi:hypothetical protein